MGTLLYASELLAQKEIDKWFQTNTTITTREFQQLLQKNHPDYDWSWLWTSKFLIDLGLTYTITNTGTLTIRVFNSPTNQKLVNKLNEAVNIIEILESQITKKHIRFLLKYSGIEYTSEQFEATFKELNLKPTGIYTSENHIIYAKHSAK
jgi:transposase